jgi:hypothetical protein
LEVKKIDLNKLRILSSSFLKFFFDGNDMWVGSDAGLLRIQIANPLAKLESK